MTEPIAPPIKKGRGCLFYGCLGGLVMLLIIVIAGLIGLRYAKKMVTDFTDSAPTPIPAVKLTPAEIEQLRKRIEDFRQAVRASRPAEPLALSADEINALIATDSDLEPFKDKIYVTIEGEQLKGRLSVSMADIGLPAFRGRYLNGAGTLKLAVHNGLLFLTAQTLEVKGKPVPEVYMQKVRMQNLAQNLNSDPRASAALDRIQDIQIKDGKVVIISKDTKLEH
jgi:hypothetical protein